MASKQKVKAVIPAASVVVALSSAEQLTRKNLREGGSTAAPGEFVFAIGGRPVVYDTVALDALVARLSAPDVNVLDVLQAPISATEAPFFIPAQRDLLDGMLLPCFPAPGFESAALNVAATLPLEHRASALPGIHVLIGPTAAGKSEVVAALPDTVIIRYGEPMEAVDFAPTTIQARDLLHALTCALVLGRLGAFPVVDSLRPAVFSLKGNTGAGGVSNSLYDLLTNFNNIVASASVVVGFTLNPMMTEDKAALVTKNVAASVAGLLEIEASRVVRITARTTKGRLFVEGDAAPIQLGVALPPRVVAASTAATPPLVDDPVAPLLDESVANLDNVDDDISANSSRRTGRRFTI